MAFLRKKRASGVQEGAAVVQVQTSQTVNNPISSYRSFTGNDRQMFRLYELLRETIPVIDAAIYKLMRLTCDFSFKCENSVIEERLSRAMSQIPCGGSGIGINTFISSYFEQLLTYGTAVGEMVTDANGFLYGLYNADLKYIDLRENGSPFDIQILSGAGGGMPSPVKRPELILLSFLNRMPGELWGTSLLRGLPFVSDILLSIFRSTGTNWDRIGNLRYAVTYKPSSETADRTNAKARAEQIASEWSKAMNDSGSVRDFVAVGDVSIKVIGADNQILDSEIPVRQMLEQIVAKTGIPPFMLGLSWSTTERMSKQQADALTSELEAYRAILTPVIYRIAEFWMRSNGYREKFEIKWSDIMLQDAVDMALAGMYEAQTEQIRRDMR